MPVTYAGGVHSYEDIGLIKKLGQNRVNVTAGSALDLFGESFRGSRCLPCAGIKQMLLALDFCVDV